MVDKESTMKARVTEDCISCGRCVEICPEVFEMGEDRAYVKVDEIPEEYQDATQEAADECPTSAIIVER
jgi:ferredoxin